MSQDANSVVKPCARVAIDGTHAFPGSTLQAKPTAWQVASLEQGVRSASDAHSRQLVLVSS
ncbi:hypothetical protein [Glutamicibacter sp. Je.9.36]|uniref:hypothetical protein n=1 Tax=Glutamicibacter sp. Je.9.36 TaxID=3142837 RepID=UPI003DA9BB5C